MLEYELSYAGVPFVSNVSKTLRRAPVERVIGTSADQEATRKHQTEVDLIDELNRVIPFQYLNDFALPPQYPGKNLGAIAQNSVIGPSPSPNVRIGDWYYPTGAQRWGVFRGLATSSQAKAMLLNVQQLTATLQGTLGPIAILKTQTLPSAPSISQLQSVPSSFLRTLSAVTSITGQTLLNTSLGSAQTMEAIQIQGTLENAAIAVPTAVIENLSVTPVAVQGPGLFAFSANPISPTNPNNNWGNWFVPSMMYLLPPRPLAEHGGDFDGLFLITLVDERYYWQYSSVSLEIDQYTTWDDLIFQVAAALGIFIFYSPISANYGQPDPDSQLWTNQENAAVLLDAIAANIGRTLVRNYNGTYSLQTPLESQALVTLNRATGANIALGPFGSQIVFDTGNVTRTAGGDIFNSGFQNLKAGDLQYAKNSILPSAVQVTFPVYIAGNSPVPHYGNARYGNQRPTSWYEDSYGLTYPISIPITYCGPTVSGLGGIPGWSYTVADTAKAVFPDENTAIPDNYFNLVSLAQQIAIDYYNKQIGAALDEVYPGTYPWTPEGFHDIIWTYSSRSRQATTRVARQQWNSMVSEMQHSTSPFSPTSTSGFLPAVYGQTNTMAGAGGKSVAQTIRDSQIDNSGVLSSFLAQDLGAFDPFAYFTKVDYLPTQNRWRGMIGSELILFEGTSGGITNTVTTQYQSVLIASGLIVPTNIQTTDSSHWGILNSSILKSQGNGSVFSGEFWMLPSNPPATLNPDTSITVYGEAFNLKSGIYTNVCLLDTLIAQGIVSIVSGNGAQFNSDVTGVSGINNWNPSLGFPVSIVSRSIDNTAPSAHSAAAPIYQVTPNTTYGVNLTTYEKSQFVYPSNWTVGGIQGVNVLPPIQNVQALSASGQLLNNILHYSGQVVTYDVTQSSGYQFVSQENVWLVERNNQSITSGNIYEGQIAGYSASGAVAPVYLCDVNATAAVNATSFWARITHKQYDPSTGIIIYSWIQETGGDQLGFIDAPTSGGPGSFPAYEVNNIDLPTDSDGQTAGGGTGLCVWPTPTTLKLIVRMWKGDGAYYLFDQSPRWEFVQKVGDICADNIYYPGYLLKYDQILETWVQTELVKIINVNG